MIDASIPAARDAPLRKCAMEENAVNNKPIPELPFEVMLATAWILGGSEGLDQATRPMIVAAALVAFPDNSVTAMTDLLLTVEDLLGDANGADVVDAFLMSGRRAGKHIPWMTILSSVRLAAQLRELDEPARQRASLMIRTWGLSPASFGI